MLHDPLSLLPEVPVLDTSNPRLIELVSLQPAGRSLGNVLDALELTNTRAHDAASDAGATAQAAIALLNRAAARGYTNIADLLALVGAPTTHTAKTSTTIRRKDVALRQLTLPHAASHGRLLPATPSKDEWQQWQSDVTECARHHCDRLQDRLRADAAEPIEVLTRLENMMAALAEPDEDGDIDRAVVNTLAVGYGTVVSLASPLGRARSGAAYDRIHHLLGAVERCSDPELCPGCADTGKCGHDSWWRPLVSHYLGPLPTPRHALNLFRPHHTKHPGVVMTAARTRSHIFAAYATWLLADFHERERRTNHALKVATTAFDRHFHDPRLVDYLAAATARGGRISDLAAALQVCETALLDRGNSTDPGWRVIDARVALLLSQQARLATPLTGLVDDEGQPIPKRRHHPTNPRRIRPLRFARG